MASQDYLIAIALIEQNLVRAMPLGGKEIKDNLEESENFKKLGEEVILNLFLQKPFLKHPHHFFEKPSLEDLK